MANVVKNLSGQRFGRLTALSENGRNNKGRVLWNCLCDCGVTVVVASNNLHSENTGSCGCLKKETNAANGKLLLTTHGLSHTPEYRAWAAMIQRCKNPKDQAYANYGARGIKVCDSWSNSFENFHKDLGSRPTSEHSIDREDNNGDYTPNNCKWSTVEEQSNNKRNNHIVTYRNKDYTIADLAREYNLKDGILRDRLRLGWSIEDAVEKPFGYRSTISNLL
jgi:hypothetical protein